MQISPEPREIPLFGMRFESICRCTWAGTCYMIKDSMLLHNTQMWCFKTKRCIKNIDEDLYDSRCLETIFHRMSHRKWENMCRCFWFRVCRFVVFTVCYNIELQYVMSKWMGNEIDGWTQPNIPTEQRIWRKPFKPYSNTEGTWTRHKAT